MDKVMHPKPLIRKADIKLSGEYSKIVGPVKDELTPFNRDKNKVGKKK